MISDRPYRRALPVSEAHKEIKPCAGTQFDPKTVAVFLSLADSLWLKRRESSDAAFRLSQLENRWPTRKGALLGPLQAPRLGSEGLREP